MSGSKIIQGLNEALAWTNGEGTAKVTMPGQPARDLTIEQYRRGIMQQPHPKALRQGPMVSFFNDALTSSKINDQD